MQKPVSSLHPYIPAAVRIQVTSITAQLPIIVGSINSGGSAVSQLPVITVGTFTGEQDTTLIVTLPAATGSIAGGGSVVADLTVITGHIHEYRINGDLVVTLEPISGELTEAPEYGSITSELPTLTADVRGAGSIDTELEPVETAIVGRVGMLGTLAEELPALFGAL